MEGLIRGFEEKKVVVVGDLMLDRYVVGSVERISPEAPVPVLLVEEERSVPGGAANVASMLATLGADTRIFGIAGDDSSGNTLCRLLSEQGVSIEGILRDRSRTTTVKSRVVAHRRQLLRVDREKAAPLERWAVEELRECILSALGWADVMLFSDYGKGVVSHGLYEAIAQAAADLGVLVCVDPEIEHFRYYRGATLITPNNEEAGEGIGTPIRDSETLNRAARAIMEALHPEYLLITRSEEGMVLFTDSQEPVAIPTVAREVFDVTGAGDMVIAVASLALACGADGKEAAVLANAAAGLEVSRFGCHPVSPDELVEAVAGCG